MKTLGYSICLGICMAVVLLVTSLPAIAGAGSQPDLPKIVRVSTFGVGTTGHALVSGMAYAVQKLTGIKMLPVPRETETGRFLSIRAREAEFAFTTAQSVSGPLAGITEFSTEAWGPQKLYRVWMGPNRAGWVASAKSGIKTLRDIKGKRVPIWPGTSGRIATDALLAYANLTWKDVIKVECPSFAGQIRAAKMGKTDIWWLGLYARYTIELAGMPQGARVVNMPPEDKQAWERLRKVAPIYTPTYYKGLPGELKEAWSTSYPYSLYCYGWISDKLAYTITKALWQGYDLYKEKHPELRYFTPDYAVDLKYLPKGYPPYHPGSVKFFKEIGVWTERHDRWQALSLRLMEERAKAWEEAKQAAKRRGIKINTKAWEEFWEDFLAAYLENKGLPSAPALRRTFRYQ